LSLEAQLRVVEGAAIEVEAVDECGVEVEKRYDAPALNERPRQARRGVRAGLEAMLLPPLLHLSLREGLSAVTPEKSVSR
jgi:hypothetical protein